MHPNPENRFSAQEASHHGWILKYSYDPLPQPHSLCSYDALSHAIKLWAVKFIIPISDLLQYHLAFIQTDKNSNGILTKEEIQEYLGKITDSEAENLINKGYWNSQGSLDFFEFVSVMADKDFLTKYTDKVCEEVDWSKNSEIDTQEFVWYLKSKLGGIDRFENSELPSTIKKEDIATFLGM
jgi:Ca2+-binding EF-hand superfamily protein